MHHRIPGIGSTRRWAANVFNLRFVAIDISELHTTSEPLSRECSHNVVCQHVEEQGSKGFAIASSEHGYGLVPRNARPIPLTSIALLLFVCFRLSSNSRLRTYQDVLKAS